MRPAAPRGGARPYLPGTLSCVSVTDTLGRPLRDLRISVTDRCNFRCVYCMPKEVFGRGYRFMDRKELLTFEEIERLARAFVSHGVEKIRITGGEPLLRRDLEQLVERLVAIGGLDVDADDERRPLATEGRGTRGGRPARASRSASTRSTTQRFAA